jgi:23S rRNA (adenine2030-N6)-methyltransferase
MLSYQHIYHAGNKADIHKHLWLIAVLEYLTRKDKPLCWIDTHAGRGIYDLQAPEAQKLSEYKDGFLQFYHSQGRSDAPEIIKSYCRAVEALNERDIRYYPGSAMLAAQMLRPSDKLYAFDLHKGEFPHLKAALESYSFAQARQEDGYTALKSLLPPDPRRGGVLIDPSYEIKSEYEACAKAVLAAHKKWPQGVYMIWYPILKAGNHKGLLEPLRAALGDDPETLLIDEWHFTDEAGNPPPKGMMDSGMAIVNCPYGCSNNISQIRGTLAP